MVLNMRKMWRGGTLAAGALALGVIGIGPAMAQGSQQAIDPIWSNRSRMACRPSCPRPIRHRRGPTPANTAQPVAPVKCAGSGYTGSGHAGSGHAAGYAPGQPQHGATYHQDDLIGAATGVFGTGAKGLAQVIQDILRKQGEPNGYIVGREAGGAFAVGLRYGSGTLYHKIEGEQPVYWTGPSIGFDAGANASKTFVLVYNLYDTGDLFHRFGAGEGQAYLVGGFNVSYLRRGDGADSGTHGRGAASGHQRRLYEVHPQADLVAVLSRSSDWKAGWNNIARPRGVLRQTCALAIKHACPRAVER
jgi:hypothetical protein